MNTQPAHGFTAICKLVVLMLFCGCTYYSGAIKVTYFGKMCFFGTTTCHSGKIDLDNWPAGLVVHGEEGVRINASSITFEQIEGQLGAPVNSFEDRNGRVFATYERGGCKAFVEKGKLSHISVQRGAVLVNEMNGMKLVMPASESEIRRVFGKPTRVEYIKRTSP